MGFNLGIAGCTGCADCVGCVEGVEFVEVVPLFRAPPKREAFLAKIPPPCRFCEEVESGMIPLGCLQLASASATARGFRQVAGRSV